MIDTTMILVAINMKFLTYCLGITKHEGHFSIPDKMAVSSILSYNLSHAGHRNYLNVLINFFCRSIIDSDL